jgi:spore germination cell wall hydrolase CwlJ-like protein
MKRTAITATRLRLAGGVRKRSRSIPLMLALLAPALGACSMSPVETASTTAATPGVKEPAAARKRAVTLAKADPREKECLVRAMYFEANRSSDAGLLGVGTVVMNRVESPRYPETICGVVGAPRQFAAGVLSRPMTERGLSRIEAIAEEILEGKRNAQVGEAKHFHTAGLRFGYKNMHYVTVAGGNAFYIKGERPERRRDEQPSYQVAALSSSAPIATTAPAGTTSFSSAPLAFAPEPTFTRAAVNETPIAKLIRSAPLPPDRPLDLDMPKRTAKVFPAQPKADMQVAALLPPPRDLRGTIPLD